MGVTFPNTKCSLIGSVRKFEKCFFAFGIFLASFGPISAKKSLNPLAISRDPDSFLSLLMNSFGILENDFFLPRIPFIVCHVFLQSVLYS